VQMNGSHAVLRPQTSRDISKGVKARI